MKGVKLQKLPTDGMDFLQIVEKVFERCNLEEIQQFVGITSRIWLHRNDVVYGRAFVHPNVLVQGALRSIDDFVSANATDVVNQPSAVVPNPVRWIAPYLDD